MWLGLLCSGALPAMRTAALAPPLPQARGDNALVTLPGNRLMVLGGETDTEGRNQVRLS